MKTLDQLDWRLWGATTGLGHAVTTGLRYAVSIPFAIVVAGLLISASIAFTPPYSYIPVMNNIVRFDRWGGEGVMCIASPADMQTTNTEWTGDKSNPFNAPGMESVVRSTFVYYCETKRAP